MANKKKSMRLEAIRTKAAEVLKTDPEIEIELNDGTTVTLVHPMFLDDETQARVDEAGDDAIKLANALLGEEEYARAHAAGLQANDVNAAYVVLNAELVAENLPR